jgi:hypothetical protein
MRDDVAEGHRAALIAPHNAAGSMGAFAGAVDRHTVDRHRQGAVADGEFKAVPGIGAVLDFGDAKDLASDGAAIGLHAGAADLIEIAGVSREPFRP